MRAATKGENGWRSVWSTIKISASPILGAYLLCLGIILIVGCGVLLVDSLFEWPLFIMMDIPITFCVLFKYALAGPIIVMENMGPWSAMRKSWQMTRGRFWYVGGNFLFLGSAMWLMRYLLHTYVHYDDRVMTGIFIILNQGCATFGQAMIILCWCLYQRIEALEPEAKITEIPTNLSPPASPCAP